MDDREQLRWSDVWLLLAIYFACQSRKPVLSEIIAAADYINHAIITFEELSRGLARLKHKELIHVDDIDSGISCSRRCIELIESVTRKTKYVDAAMKELERALKVVLWSPGDPLPSPEDCLEFPGLKRENYDSAVKGYRKRSGNKKRTDPKTVEERHRSYPTP